MVDREILDYIGDAYLCSNILNIVINFLPRDNIKWYAKLGEPHTQVMKYCLSKQHIRNTIDIFWNTIIETDNALLLHVCICIDGYEDIYRNSLTKPDYCNTKFIAKLFSISNRIGESTPNCYKQIESYIFNYENPKDHVKRLCNF